jgi:hypothetical protein
MLSAIISSILSYWTLRLAPQFIHHWYAHFGPLVLEAASLNFPTLMADRNRPVSQRSEPNSRTALTGEQPDPWDILLPQDAMSRHRGAKQRRRYELLDVISLLSPAYLLSVKWWPFHTEPPDHYNQLSFLLDMYVLQSSRLLLLHSTDDFQPSWTCHCAPSLLFRRRPPQSNYPPCNVLKPDNGN